MMFKRRSTFVLCIPLLLLSGALVYPQEASQSIPKMTGRYHFLGPQDTLAILQEEDLLKGYIDVYPGENESDVILSYPITIGSRHGNQVEFRTRKIHEKYYRFQGKVERGTGSKPGDPDYLQLIGELQIITENSVTGERKVQKQQVILKSLGKNEGPPQ